MPDGAAFSLFLIAALALLMTPGPTVTYIVATTLGQGRRAGLISALGMELGGLLHVAVAALGLSAAVATSPLMLSVVRFAGAAFLLWLGLRSLFRPSAEAAGAAGPESLGRVFWQGMVVNTLNPNRIIFFLAFLPRFVNPRGSMLPQVLFLGMMFVLMAIVTDSSWALIASTAGTWFKGRGGLGKAGRYLPAAVYIILGVGAAISGARHD